MIPENDSFVQRGVDDLPIVKPESDNIPEALKARPATLPMTNACTEIPLPEVRFTGKEKMRPRGAALDPEIVDRYMKAAGVDWDNAITAPIIDKMPSAMIDDILAMYRQFEDKALDQDVKLLEALRALGARITIEERGFLSEDGPIFIVLPPRYKRADREIERRNELRKKAVDDAARYAWPLTYCSPFSGDPEDPWGFKKGTTA